MTDILIAPPPASGADVAPRVELPTTSKPVTVIDGEIVTRHPITIPTAAMATLAAAAVVGGGVAEFTDHEAVRNWLILLFGLLLTLTLLGMSDSHVRRNSTR